MWHNLLMSITKIVEHARLSSSLKLPRPVPLGPKIHRIHRLPNRMPRNLVNYIVRILFCVSVRSQANPSACETFRLKLFLFSCSNSDSFHRDVVWQFSFESFLTLHLSFNDTYYSFVFPQQLQATSEAANPVVVLKLRPAATDATARSLRFWPRSTGRLKCSDSTLDSARPSSTPSWDGGCRRKTPSTPNGSSGTWGGKARKTSRLVCQFWKLAPTRPLHTWLYYRKVYI